LYDVEEKQKNIYAKIIRMQSSLPILDLGVICVPPGRDFIVIYVFVAVSFLKASLVSYVLGLGWQLSTRTDLTGSRFAIDQDGDVSFDG
jgi:hypothetical protein